MILRTIVQAEKRISKKRMKNAMEMEILEAELATLKVAEEAMRPPVEEVPPLLAAIEETAAGGGHE
jgi:hypothetical protein